MATETDKHEPTLEVVRVDGLPDRCRSTAFYACLRGPMNSGNWPLDWSVNEGDGDVRLVVGEGTSAEDALQDAMERVVGSGLPLRLLKLMTLREAERVLYPHAHAE